VSPDISQTYLNRSTLVAVREPPQASYTGGRFGGFEMLDEMKQSDYFYFDSLCADTNFINDPHALEGELQGKPVTT
jgi:hypothetical protein